MIEMENLSKESVVTSENSSELIDITEDSGFSSMSGSSDFYESKVAKVDDARIPIPRRPGTNIQLHSFELKKKGKEERKRKRQQEAEEKQNADDQYLRELQENRYKSLMHLLGESQFYSQFITKKIAADSVEPKRAKRGRKPKVETNKEVQKFPLNNTKKTTASKKKDLQEYGSVDFHSKIKDKANLSNEEIEAILSQSSDEENSPPMEENQPFVHPKYFHGILHEYQQDGLQWLKVLYENGLNGILADEMGLGKTVQVIALMCHLIEKNQGGPFLIVVPLSTVPNWLIEFERFAPDLPVVLFHGNSQERKLIYKKINTSTTFGNCRTQPIVITTYEVPLMEKSFLGSKNWRYIIIDEGHRIKNSQSLLSRILRTFKSSNRLLLTGTPLQNDLAELWSLLNFLMPALFKKLDVFESWFDVKELQDEEGTEKFLKQEEEKKILASLREILKPFMLRRVKSDVNLQIPAKKEVIVYAPISELQRDLYKAVLTRDIHQLLEEEKEPVILMSADGSRPKRRCVLSNLNNSSNYISFKDSTGASSRCPSPIPSTSSEDSVNLNWKLNATFDQKNLNKWKEYTTISENICEYLVRMKFGNRSMFYKKIVNHPYLVYCPMDYSGLPKIDEDLIKSSGKLLVLDKLLAKLKAAGHRVLLFSTMTQLLDMIEDYLTMRDYVYVRLDGNTKLEDRKENIKNFNSNPNVFLFLISTRAGGIGVNLASADTVIMYDSDWNPQADIQAMARCHRIGQTKPVVIYRLCSKGTIDETIVKRAEAKRKLEKMVISKASDVSSSLNNKETLLKLRELLESTECEIVSPNKDVFSEKELDKLLDRSDLLRP